MIQLLRRRRRGERGYVLATTALVLIPMLIVAGMAIDFGGLYTEAAKMQRAADAAALAGVVWLPNLTNATTVAKASAKENGYDDALANITVTVTQLAETELKVTITNSASPIYLAKMVKQSASVTRSSTADYVLPVPLGSPKNYFGTGDMISGTARENFYAAVNNSCWDKIQGDPFAVSNISATCSGAANTQFRASPKNQYEYYIELPAGRTQSVVVSIWSPADPSKDAADPGGTTSSSNVTLTFNLQTADSTPLDDSDNPVTSCTGSGESNPRTYTAVDNDATLLGRAGWSTFCTIPSTAPAGKYILGVRNKQPETGTMGLNAYSIMASYNGAGVTCDGRTDTTCPKIYGKSWISIYANATGSQAKFFLAEIGPQHAGKTVKITLFDPGEGGDNIRLIKPDGSYASFTAQDMGTDGNSPGTLISSSSALDVTASKYNGKFVELTTVLPLNYNALGYSDYWWKVEYNFAGGSTKVTDRTTWGVRVIGDPVHLTE